MNLRSISVALLLLCLFTKLSSSSNNQADFADVSVNCGSSGASAARSRRKWLGDVRSKLTPFLQLGGLSAASTAVNKLTVADPVPHNTARISRSQFSYAFQLNQGQKIIRLHFNPTEYRGFKGLKDLFTVEAGSFTLLSNFSTSLTADFLGVNTFSKEFCLMIQENQKLRIVFYAQSLDTYAYVNGIEIISVPASLSYFVGGDIVIRVIGQNSLVYVDNNHNTTALEIVHQISTKQDLVSSADGSRKIFAMRLDQRVDNKTWTMPVDVGFSYLIRLHLSEFSNVGLNYKVLINQVVASSGYGTIKERDDSRYVDYVVAMNGRKQEGKRNILICLQSNQEHMDMHGTFKGFEILKLSNRDNSLAAPNPQPSAQDLPSKTFRHVFMILGRSHRNAIATIAIAAISLVNIIVHELRGRWEASGSEEENKPSAGAERVCRRFSLAEIKLATGDFNEGFVIGNGGFGKVYKGLIDDWQKTVAVKKLKPNSKQGEREFITEIETLSEILHNNVVSLIGYCSEHAEMIIVYEYMARGTLADHLYKLPRADSEFSCLTWKQRLNICIGVARGLEYLHTGRGIIHRDLKASNILLDENLVAKVSDFGLAKPEKRNKLHSHVSTNVKGTNGYIDPYYKTTSKLIRKSDTYSFGVVLLEVLCGRRAVDSKVPPDERILTKWAQDKISKGEVDRIIASSIREEISPNSLKTFVGVAGRCLDNEPKNRPTMSEVVLQLEFSLKQQESNQNLVLNEIPSVSDAIHPSTSNDRTDIRSTKHTTTYLPLPQHAHTSGKVVVDAEVTSGRKQWTKFTTIKLLKFRPWQAFWKRVKTSKKDKWPFSDLDVIYDVDNLQYEYSRIRAATRNFSEANKLGEGGFGPVYKGILLNGKEIAVKRLSANSMQGNREFKNELLLLANLQHRNLIRLLGFCLESSERLLIYEFVENSSLDRFIFDPLKRSYLDWNRLHKIIQGIAMGLVYLHQDSRLRIIHRDLKASNVLLDGDWNPKVADFGIARLSGGDETQGETTRVMGTSGYMAPEYLVKGQVSDKTDVFSFGVLVLEILRGQRSSHFQNEEKLSFVDRGWKSWSEGTVANLIDPTLRANTGSLDDVLRCFHIGLLCVQENPSSRPTMASVSLMLSTSTAELPVPSMPAFYMSNAQIFSSEDTCSPYTSYEGQSISKCYVSDEEAPMLTYRRRGRKAEITD